MRLDLPHGPAVIPATLLSLLLAAACKPQSAPQPAPAPAPAKELAAGPTPAAPEPAAATPTAPAESATATAPAAEATAAAADLDTSVAIYVDSGSGDTATPPQAGKPVTITVTPVDGNGRPLRKRQPILGHDLVLLAMRHDLTWVQAFGAKQLSEPGGLSHRFQITVPKSGRHMLYFLVQPQGGPMSVTPVDLTFAGPEIPGLDWGDDQTRATGPKGMSIDLKQGFGKFEPCQRNHIATNWVAKGKPVNLLGAADAAKVVYLAIPQTMGLPSLGRALRVAAAVDTAADPSATAGMAAESVASIGGDLGTDAWLTLKMQGKHKIVAIAQLPSERGASAPGALTAAVFAVTASGTTPADGCP